MQKINHNYTNKGIENTSRNYDEKIEQKYS